ncbi:glycerate kinase [Geodermatophilus sabuli]|uniref:Glycerate kinase n=1 Tax=Geodermatophilus sabuli TaxID=1564158 RepID=A0A285EJ95_9ACTN|nr:glycerate kinase [Geodermatophilus sabuli]MBB3083660.1 glycerate kinase [Geodermatophilus sabuli]SNX99090.1 glycerate kinase [Geodermatophilus sabuli]
MTGPRIVLAPDKFKGSLSAAEVAAALARGLRRALPDAELVQTPIADGGEGTVDLVLAHGFTPRTCEVPGPLGQPVAARYAVRGDTAVAEMSAAAGLGLLPPPGPTERTALHATTLGVGRLVADALDAGARRVVLGVGGSATTDGGAGALVGLGARVLTADGAEVPPGGAVLATADRLDLSGLDPRLAGTELVVACDVDNPLTGPEGAAAVYGPQKGATPDAVATLDAALARWADVVAAATGADRRGEPGAGAAGGIAFGLSSVLGARLTPGVRLLLDLTGFADTVRGAALVVVGEGSLDAQSLRGKGPIGLAALAHEVGTPVVAAVGRSLISPEEARAAGLGATHPLTDLEPDPERCMTEAAALLETVGRRIGEDLRARH